MTDAGDWREIHVDEIREGDVVMLNGYDRPMTVTEVYTPPDNRPAGAVGITTTANRPGQGFILNPQYSRVLVRKDRPVGDDWSLNRQEKLW